MNIYHEQEKNIRKTWVLMVTFLLAIIGLGWFFSAVLNQPVILYAAVGFSIFMNVFSYWHSDKLVIATVGAKPMKDEGGYREVHNILENLSIAAGLPKPKLYVMDDPAPNAFATGRDEKHAAVAVTTGLLSMMDRSELEGVLSHELAHIGNRDMLLMTVAVVLVGFVTLLSDLFLRFSFHSSGDRDNRAGTIAMAAGIALALLSPLIATLIQLAISRKREFLADASGALLTRYPEGLASALSKIGSYNRPMRTANHATAHLFIGNPFGGSSKTSFLNKLFLTHPPVEERIVALRGGSF